VPQYRPDRSKSALDAVELRSRIVRDEIRDAWRQEAITVNHPELKAMIDLAAAMMEDIHDLARRLAQRRQEIGERK